PQRDESFSSASSLPRPYVARLAGAFRGYGGLFLEPPLVAVIDDRLLVRAGEEAWLLEADVFGATFHRATPGEADAFPAPSSQPISVPKPVRGDDRVVALGEITSAARCGPTLALT